MNQTREILSFNHDKTHTVVFEQELRGSGWYNLRARSATPHDIETMSHPQPKSGSAGDHARLAPSAASRWRHCTRSISYAAENEERIFNDVIGRVLALIPYLDTFPDEWYDHEKIAIPLVKKLTRGKRTIESLTADERKAIWRSDGNAYSREGSRAHDFASDILRGKKTEDDIPEEFRQPVMFYVNHCREMAESGGDVYIEAKVPLFYDPVNTGTVDHAVVSPSRIIISDLKYGKGDLVDPEENEQLGTYSLSLVEDLLGDGLMEFEPDTIVEIWIVQPRHHAEDPRRKWEVTLSDLREFGRGIHYAAIQVQEGRGLKFEAGEKICKYCDCKAFCGFRASAMAEVFSNGEVLGTEILAAFEELDKKEAKALTPCQRVEAQAERAGIEMPLSDKFRVKIEGAKDAIISWLNDNTASLAERVLGGERIEGLKIVAGREGNREWKDEEAAQKFLAGKLKIDEVAPRKLIGPAGVEKLLTVTEQSTKWQNLYDGHITRSPAKKVMALASDKRQAVDATITAFGDIDDADADLEDI